MFVKPAIHAYVKPDVRTAQFPGLGRLFLNVLLLIKTDSAFQLNHGIY